MGENYRQVGPTLDQLARAAGKIDDETDSTPEPRYPRSLSPAERKTAAENIKKELHGKTGRERAEKRAELMDPGPSDDASIEEHRKAARAFQEKHDFEAKNPEQRAEFAHKAKRHLQAAVAGANRARKAEGRDDYESEERAAIQGEGASKGSTNFNFGHNTRKAQIAAKASKTTPTWRTRTPAGYEKKERAAIRGEGESKGSTSFP